MKRIIAFSIIFCCFSQCQIISGKSTVSGKVTLAGVKVGSGSPAATFVQACVGNSSSATATCSTGSNITSGNLLVIRTKSENNVNTGTVVVSISSGTGTCGTVSYVVNATTLNGNFVNAMAYCIVSGSGSATLQAAWSATQALFTDISVAEYSPGSAWGSPILDQTTNFITSPAAATCSTGTTSATSNANDLVIATCDVWNNAQTWNALSGYNNRASAERNTSGWYDNFVTSTGTQTAAIPLSVNDTGTGIIVAFKD